MPNLTLFYSVSELGAGGAMSSYKWNGGGVFKGKPWGQHLPTDAAVCVQYWSCIWHTNSKPTNLMLAAFFAIKWYKEAHCFSDTDAFAVFLHGCTSASTS